MIQSVVIIGSGNLATQLALALAGKEIQVGQVYSRTLEGARELAQKVNAPFTNDLSSLAVNCDLYVVAVKDSAIREVLMNMPPDKNRLLVHTAGSIAMKELAPFSDHHGVFYPLQTFSKTRKADFSNIPLCIEASDADTLQKLQQLAQRLSSSVQQVNSQDRKTLHLGAVFVNNFVNHLYAIGAEILEHNQLDFNLLKPLIRETASKIESIHPLDAQTGPALRNDQQIAQAHLKMLENQPEFQEIYSFVTKSIAHFHQKQKNDLL